MGVSVRDPAEHVLSLPPLTSPSFNLVSKSNFLEYPIPPPPPPLSFSVCHKKADSFLRLYFSNTGISISPEASSSISDYLTLPSPDYLTNLNTNNNDNNNDNDHNKEEKEMEDNDDNNEEEDEGRLCSLAPPPLYITPTHLAVFLTT